MPSHFSYCSPERDILSIFSDDKGYKIRAQFTGGLLDGC